MMGELYANDGISNHFFTHLLPYVNTADIYSKNPEVVKGPFGDTPDLVLGWHDWWKEMYGTAFDHSHNLSISGGSENPTTMLLSVIWIKDLCSTMENTTTRSIGDGLNMNTI